MSWCLGIFLLFFVTLPTTTSLLSNNVEREMIKSAINTWKSFAQGNPKKDVVKSTPPDHKKYVAMARYIMHQADWTSIATISMIPKIKDYPFTSVVSMSDGTVDKSVGVPYFYLTPLDFPSKDLKNDNRCTISASLIQTDYCRSMDYVPDDPRCARVMLTGRMERMKNGTAEYDFAKKALFTRHHSMANLPTDHGFYVAKLNIEQIVMLDWFGGPQYISVEEYLAYKGADIN